MRISPTGLTVWPVPGSEALTLTWTGPDSGLFLGMHADQPGGSMVRVDHPSADGTYATRKQAAKAVVAFIAADPKS